MPPPICPLPPVFTLADVATQPSGGTAQSIIWPTAARGAHECRHCRHGPGCYGSHRPGHYEAHVPVRTTFVRGWSRSKRLSNQRQMAHPRPNSRVPMPPPNHLDPKPKRRQDATVPLCPPHHQTHPATFANQTAMHHFALLVANRHALPLLAPLLWPPPRSRRLRALLSLLKSQSQRCMAIPPPSMAAAGVACTAHGARGSVGEMHRAVEASGTRNAKSGRPYPSIAVKCISGAQARTAAVARWRCNMTTPRTDVSLDAACSLQAIRHHVPTPTCSGGVPMTRSRVYHGTLVPPACNTGIGATEPHHRCQRLLGQQPAPPSTATPPPPQLHQPWEQQVSTAIASFINLRSPPPRGPTPPAGPCCVMAKRGRPEDSSWWSCVRGCPCRRGVGGVVESGVAEGPRSRGCRA